MRLAEGEIGAFVDERDALGVAEVFALSKDRVPVLAGEGYVLEEVENIAFCRGEISAFLDEREDTEFVLLL